MSDFYQTWRAGKTLRMHTMPQLHKESVGEHTWGVLMMAVKFFPKASAEFLRYLVLHDAPEQATGDIPAHIKWSSPELEAVCHQKEMEWLETHDLDLPVLTPNETSLFIVFDKLDFCISCIHEMRLGNLNSARYFKRSYGKAQEEFYKMAEGTSEFAAAELAMSAVSSLRETYCSHIPDEEYERGR